MSSRESGQGAGLSPGLAARHDSARFKILAALLILSEVLYVALLRLNAVNGVRPVMAFLALMAGLFALYAAACLLIAKLRGHRRSVLWVVGAGAVLFRLTLIPAGLAHGPDSGSILAGLASDLQGQSVTYERFLLYDDDLWRYLWDGHVLANGGNPYRDPPASPALDCLAAADNPAVRGRRPAWSDIRANIGYPEMQTIYPPLAQAVFLLSNELLPASVTAMKALVVCFDLVAAVFLALTLDALGRPMALVALYAWNPLVIKVFAGSGHIDSVLVAALAATTYFLVRNQRALAAASFGLAVLAKLSPVVLAPFLARRVGRRDLALAVGLAICGYLPFLGAGRKLFEGLAVFARSWQFNAGPLDLLRWAFVPLTAHPALLARSVCGLGILALIAWLTKRDDGKAATFASAAVAALGGLLVLSPAVMPWYATWLLPFAVIAGRREWLWFSAIVCLAFLVMINAKEYSAALWTEYGAFAALLLVEIRRRRAWARLVHAGDEPGPQSVPASP